MRKISLNFISNTVLKVCYENEQIEIQDFIAEFENNELVVACNLPFRLDMLSNKVLDSLLFARLSLDKLNDCFELKVATCLEDTKGSCFGKISTFSGKVTGLENLEATSLYRNNILSGLV